MKNRMVFFLGLGLCLLACSGGTDSSEAGRKAQAGAQNPGPPEALSPAGEQELRAIVASARLDDLQWPNFSAQSAAVKEFYDQAGYRLGWSRSGRPTPQATESIGILEDAD